MCRYCVDTANNIWLRALGSSSRVSSKWFETDPYATCVDTVWTHSIILASSPCLLKVVVFRQNGLKLIHMLYV